MLIKDHISVFAPNPLIGQNIEELGVRFPDMSSVYDEELQELIKKTAKEQHIFLQEGIYAQLTGPSFESPAEIRMLRTLGCRCGGNEYRGRGNRGKSYGNEDLRNFLYQQSGGRTVEKASLP